MSESFYFLLYLKVWPTDTETGALETRLVPEKVYGKLHLQINFTYHRDSIRQVTQDRHKPNTLSKRTMGIFDEVLD